MSRSVSVRDASAEDVDFLRQMLYEAVYWKPDRPRPAEADAFENRELAKLLAGWGRSGDAGVVAELQPGSTRVAAAWYRYWTDDEHSYGYVDPQTPEAVCAVAPAQRGRGLGLLVMRELINRARRAGVSRMSLSVEQENEAALRLYRRLGFRTYTHGADTYTMIAEV
jgi:ribosomal protein S18 acetylase RimI-like enzyme